MPRQARIDIPGFFYHVMARGIERRKIFFNSNDYSQFVHRLSGVIQNTQTRCFAWALMPNHIHLLLQPGVNGLAHFMQRLLTGYAGWFNFKHNRVGHLFQNRYKSIVCDPNRYFLALVRYIHLNPVKSGLVKDLQQLSHYPWTGHSAILRRIDRPWQDVSGVLSHWGTSEHLSQKKYLTFIQEGFSEIKKKDYDDRIFYQNLIQPKTQQLKKDTSALLGIDYEDSAFDEFRKRENMRVLLNNGGVDPISDWVADYFRLPKANLYKKGKSPQVSTAKAVLIYFAAIYLGAMMKSLAKITQMSGPGASKARSRGENIVKKNGLHEKFESYVVRNVPSC